MLEINNTNSLGIVTAIIAGIGIIALAIIVDNSLD